MRTIRMRRSKKLLHVTDTKAAKYIRMGLASEEHQREVIKMPAPIAAQPESLESSPKKNKRRDSEIDETANAKRRYGRRDMIAEDNNCLDSQECKESLDS